MSEFNNRDGSAIRYAIEYLTSQSAKTKFLFHLSDMKPSDVEMRRSDAILSFPYQGEDAYADVTHAFNTARSRGIIPVGICLRRKTSEKEKPRIIPRGKLNPAVLAKISQQRVASSEENIDARLRKNFRSHYRIVDDLSELPDILREVYITASFR